MEPEDPKLARNGQREAQLSRRSVLIGSAIAVAAGAGMTLLERALPASANAAWGGYSNGQIPLSALTIVSYPGVIPFQYSSAALPYVYLVSGCSDRLLQMLQKYHDEVGGYLRVAEGYRTLAGQQYWAGKGGGTVGQSNHGWGEAVDFDSGILRQHPEQVDWLNANGPAYGFSPLAGDLGHYNYTGPITPPPLTTQNRQVEMELYAANPPATIPAKYLALNGGLTTGVPIYMLIPAVGIPRVTEDQNLVSRWAQSIFGQTSAQAVIQISWGWFDQLFDQQYAIAHSLGAS